jgi:hypothetical protein
MGRSVYIRDGTEHKDDIDDLIYGEEGEAGPSTR